MKRLLILAFLFLGACAQDSKNGDGRADPEQISTVSAEVLERAEVLSLWYEVSIQNLGQVDWYVPGDETAATVEGFVFGSTLPSELLDVLDRVPKMIETLMKIQDHNPRSREMLNLARQSLEN